MTGQRPRRTSPLIDAFATEVRAITAARRITAREMSRRTGIGYSTYTRIEQGNRPPDAWQMQMIAQALDMPMSELLRRAEDLLDAEDDDEGRRAASDA